ncbi:MAG: RNA exonuclease 3 [Vezdaea aestivalis]|nr:MAG: RNA exonuclease 3 [Vezdaea aestivalis]
MFSSVGLFSKVPCPSDRPCLFPNCIFSHLEAVPNQQRQGQTAVPNVTNGLSQKINTQYVARHEEGGNKRQKTLSGEKTDDALPSQASFPLPGPRLLSRQTTENQAQQKDRRDKSPSLNPEAAPFEPRSREESPIAPERRSLSPPQKRKLPKPAETPQSAHSVSTLPTPQSTPSTPSTLKKEPLFPRRLPNPPAKLDIRTTLVRKFHEQHVRLNNDMSFPSARKLFDQEVISIALDDEERFARGVATTYSNLAKIHLMNLKKMDKESWVKKYASTQPGDESASRAKKPKQGDGRVALCTNFNAAQQLSIISKFEAKTADMDIVGYARAKPSAEEIEIAKKGVEAAQSWEQCDRCQYRFQVFPGRNEDGRLTSGGTCCYHWARPAYTRRDNAKPENNDPSRIYPCCNEPIGTSTGCTRARSHVFKVTSTKRLAATFQFEPTPTNYRVKESNAFCVDCEMGFTVNGLELIRLTATSWPSDDEVIDVLVRPHGEILDLNSRFSGVFAKDITSAKSLDRVKYPNIKPKADEKDNTLFIVSSPTAARKLLWEYITPSTFLIGHGLENDLNALRMIHPRVIDTALLFPHPKKLPVRNSLKYLMSSVLQRNIQLGDLGQGHDSKEDARAAGELVKWKVEKEWKVMQQKGWQIDVSGLLYPPPRPSKT